MKQSQRTTGRQILVLLLLLLLSLEIIFGACPRGYFGQHCSYRCNCRYLNCHDDGNCFANSSCFENVFGPECQYINMVNKTYGADWIHDNNDSTCSPKSTPGDVNISLTTTTVMTWLRIHFQNPQRISDAYQAVNVKINGTDNCVNKRVYMVRTWAMDVSCDNIVLMSTLTISGNITMLMCNIFVSGGRNVAYKQNTTVIGIGRNFSTQKPVDENRYCQIAFPEVATQVIIEHRNPHVLYKIHFVLPQSTTTSHDFLIKLLSGSKETISRTVRSVMQSKLDVFLFDWNPFTTIHIQVNPEVEFCEVEAIGETWCELNHYGYDCEHACQCQPNEICFPATGMCGPECPPGSYGFLCSLTCARGCLNKKCDYRDGKCSCGPGFSNDGVCNTECSAGMYGTNCSEKCSGHCKETAGCDRANGNCTKCVAGYFGSGCQFQCPTYCLDNKCNEVTGACVRCVSGYFGENCTSKCSDGCLNSQCNVTTGSCFRCKMSRFGVRACQASECEGSVLVCAKKCGDGCLNRLCNQMSGACFACASGFEGPFCVATGTESKSILWLVIISLPLLILCIISALCVTLSKKKTVATDEEKVKKASITSSRESDSGSSWTFATSYVTVSTMSDPNLSETDTQIE